MIFLFLQNKATNPIDIPPVIATPHHYLISIYRFKGHLKNTVVTENFVGSWDGRSWKPVISNSFLFSRCNIFFVAVCMTEVPPLFVIEFLHRVVDTMEDYFSECSETIIKDNYVVVYEVVLEDSFLKIFYDA